MTLKGSESIRLNSLTGLRFLAALVVVLQHATRHFAQVPVLSELFDQGAVGVTFFFILSGFVLTWSHKPVRSKWNFYRNRFARVYPLHLLTLLLSIPLVLAAQEFSWTSLVATVLLLQAWSPDRMVQFAMNGPSWSLSCEAFFYAVFPFLITPISRLRRISIVRQAIALVAILGAVFAVLAFVYRGEVGNMLGTNPLYRLGEFLIGMGLAALLKTGYRFPVSVRFAVITAVTSFVAVGAVNFGIVQWSSANPGGPTGIPPILPNGLMTPAFVLLVVAFAQSDILDKNNFLKSPMMQRLGNWSFALYLSNLLVIGAADHFIGEELPLAVRILKLAGVLLICIGVSALLYHLVEKPLESKLRGHAGGLSETQAPAI